MIPKCLGIERVETEGHSSTPLPFTKMLSRVSYKVMPQPPSANKKKDYEINEVLGTGSFGKVMVSLFHSS